MHVEQYIVIEVQVLSTMDILISNLCHHFIHPRKFSSLL